MFCYQVVVEVVSKRCLIKIRKGVSKGLKGHLLQAKRALIESQLTPFLFLNLEFYLHYIGLYRSKPLYFTIPSITLLLYLLFLCCHVFTYLRYCKITYLVTISLITMSFVYYVYNYHYSNHNYEL